MIDFKPEESTLYINKTCKMTYEQRQQKQAAFEQERALLFKETNKPLYTLISSGVLPCVSLANSFVLDIKHATLYYANYDVTECIAKELIGYYTLDNNYTFREFLGVLEGIETDTIARVIAKVLWGFDATNYKKSVSVVLVKQID